MSRITLAIAVAALSTALAAPTLAQDVKLRLAYGTSELHPWQRGAEMFKEGAESRAPGLEIQLFGNRQLGGDKEVLEGTIVGTIDCSMASSVLFPLVVKKASFDALQLPYLVNSYDNLGKLMASDIGAKMLASLDDVGLKGLGFIEAGQRHFLNRSGPVKKLSDFNGLKTRIVPVPLHKAMWETVGSNPVGIAYGEVYTSMQTNVIDAVEFNISSIESENLYEVGKHVSLTGHYFWPGVIACNRAKFESLPENMQKALIEAGHETIEAHVAFVKAHETEAAERLKEKGVQIYEFEDLAAMQALMAPIVEEWSTKDPLIGEYIEAAKKLEAM